MTEDKRIVWTNIDLDPEDWYHPNASPSKIITE